MYINLIRDVYFQTIRPPQKQIFLFYAIAKVTVPTNDVVWMFGCCYDVKTLKMMSL